IRRSCAPDDEVCRRDGTLGLILPIVVPDVWADDLRYTNATCTNGTFKWLDASPSGVCADNGRPAIACPIFNADGSGTQDPARQCCLLPTTRWGIGNCLSRADNKSVFVPNGTDARFFNLAARLGREGKPVIDNQGRAVEAAYYRLFSDRAQPCRED